MRFVIISMASLFICMSCKDKATIKDQTGKDFKLLPVHLFDSIEHFFGNENWLLTRGNDSSYLLFSRQTGNLVNIYQYRMVRGDSVNTVMTTIQFRNDTVVWNDEGHQLFLQKAGENLLSWSEASGTTTWNFQKINTDHILLKKNNDSLLMRRTPTLSDFLVRSKYDHLHGTHLAFDTIKFKGKPKNDKGRLMINEK